MSLQVDGKNKTVLEKQSNDIQNDLLLHTKMKKKRRNSVKLTNLEPVSFALTNICQCIVTTVKFQ